jgi:hypothetical protein
MHNRRFLVPTRIPSQFCCSICSHSKMQTHNKLSLTLPLPTAMTRQPYPACKDYRSKGCSLSLVLVFCFDSIAHGDMPRQRTVSKNKYRKRARGHGRILPCAILSTFFSLSYLLFYYLSSKKVHFIEQH